MRKQAILRNSQQNHSPKVHKNPLRDLHNFTNVAPDVNTTHPRKGCFSFLPTPSKPKPPPKPTHFWRNPLSSLPSPTHSQDSVSWNPTSSCGSNCLPLAELLRREAEAEQEVDKPEMSKISGGFVGKENVVCSKNTTLKDPTSGSLLPALDFGMGRSFRWDGCVSSSGTRISWRVGLVGRMIEMGELGVCDGVLNEDGVDCNGGVFSTQHHLQLRLNQEVSFFTPKNVSDFICGKQLGLDSCGESIWELIFQNYLFET